MKSVGLFLLGCGSLCFCGRSAYKWLIFFSKIITKNVVSLSYVLLVLFNSPIFNVVGGEGKLKLIPTKVYWALSTLFCFEISFKVVDSIFNCLGCFLGTHAIFKRVWSD